MFSVVCCVFDCTWLKENMKNNGLKNHQQSERQSLVDDFKFNNENFEETVRQFNLKYQKFMSDSEVISRKDSSVKAVKQSCEEMFELKGKLYALYQRLIEIYGKVYDLSKDCPELQPRIAELDEVLRNIKNQTDIARKCTRHASQIYENN